MRPIGDHVLVTPIPEETKIGSFVIPDSAKDKPNRGSVVAVGEGRVLPDGTARPIKLSEGDRVIFSKYAGNEFSDAGTDYILISFDDVLAVLD